MHPVLSSLPDFNVNGSSIGIAFFMPVPADGIVYGCIIFTGQTTPALGS
jgi:hypothetical protein